MADVADPLEGPAPVAPPIGQRGPRRKKPNRGRAGGRTKSKLVYLTDAENTNLEARARAAGLSIASYLRASALGDAGPRARFNTTVDRELLAKAVAELNKVGSNVNQIARALNIGKDHDEELFRAVLGQLQRVLADVREAIRT